MEKIALEERRKVIEKDTFIMGKIPCKLLTGDITFPK
jgi:hypothetical protein